MRGQSNEIITALYCRLSREDEQDGDSNSIVRHYRIIIRKLYEDNISGKLTDKRFKKLSGEYEREQE